MPPYPWMLKKAAPLHKLPARLAALRAAGVPYSQTEIDDAESDALAQGRMIAEEIETQGGGAIVPDRQIIALVAYLQRLGTDIKLVDQASATTFEAPTQPTTELP